MLVITRGSNWCFSNINEWVKISMRSRLTSITCWWFWITWQGSNKPPRNFPVIPGGYFHTGFYAIFRGAVRSTKPGAMPTAELVAWSAWIWGFPFLSWGYTAGWFIMKNPSKMEDFGAPPILGNLYVWNMWEELVETMGFCDDKPWITMVIGSCWADQLGATVGWDGRQSFALGFFGLSIFWAKHFLLVHDGSWSFLHLSPRKHATVIRIRWEMMRPDGPWMILGPLGTFFRMWKVPK